MFSENDYTINKYMGYELFQSALTSFSFLGEIVSNESKSNGPSSDNELDGAIDANGGSAAEAEEDNDHM